MPEEKPPTDVEPELLRTEPAPAEPTTTEEADVEPQVPPWEGLLRRYRPDPYALDHLSRSADRDERGRLQCPELDLVTHKGEHVRYHKSIRVNDFFRERLVRFEEVVARVGEEVYGRAPSRIVHYGTYNCRTIRHRKYRLSEHALGNAIDIAEFRFDAAPRDKRKEARDFPGAFRVNVERHWEGEEGKNRTHSVFLKTLVNELRNDDVFRGMIVPPARGHKNHLHLDMGRWSYLRGDPYIPTPQGEEGVL